MSDINLFYIITIKSNQYYDFAINTYDFEINRKPLNKKSLTKISYINFVEIIILIDLLNYYSWQRFGESPFLSGKAAVRSQRIQKQEASLRTAGQRESCDRHISRSRNCTTCICVARAKPRRHMTRRMAKKANASKKRARR